MNPEELLLFHTFILVLIAVSVWIAGDQLLRLYKKRGGKQ